MNLLATEDTDKKNIAIVDDHFAIRDGYTIMLKNISYIDEVYAYPTAKEFLYELKSKKIDLVLLDIQLKNEDGIEICQMIKQQFKNVKVVMLSSHHSNEYIIKADQYGADGYLFKDAEPIEVRIALDRVVNQQEKYYSPEAKEIIFDHERVFKNNSHNISIELTKREIQIMKLVCNGKSNKEIGLIFNRDETTIAKHKQNLMKKINAHKSMEIINYAIENGYFNPKYKS